MAPPRRRARSLAGTNLYVDRAGYFRWRGTNPTTGKRVQRSTGVKVLELARRKARDFEQELERAAVGLDALACWKIELRPLVAAWADWQAGQDVGEATVKTRRFQVERALEDLHLERAADLDRVAQIDDRLRALGRAQGLDAVRLRRTYQVPLRMFSAWLAANRRHLDRDPLTTWKLLKIPPAPAARRAFLPSRAARAFLALERLDELLGRKGLPLAFMLELVVAPRSGALLSRDVTDFDPKRARIELGADVGKKRRGAGALDLRTAAELEASLAARAEGLDKPLEGPLVLSPKRARWTRERFLDCWRQAYGVGLADELWPKGEAKSFADVRLVELALRTGTVRVSKGGNPGVVVDKTREKRAALAFRIGAIADQLRDDWTAAMEGVDVHSFRKTHRTWAELLGGVPPVVIDRQLGHAARGEGASLEEARAVLGSATGRRFYLDDRFPLLDAQRSATAVRGIIDAAIAQARLHVDSVLGQPLKTIQQPLALPG